MGDQQHALVGCAHDAVDARADGFAARRCRARCRSRRGPRSCGCMMPIWTISARFFSPPEKPTLTGRLSISASMPSSAACSRASLMNSAPDSSASPRARRCELRLSRRNWSYRHAGDFDRILEAEEQPRRGALVRLHGEQSCPSPLVSSEVEARPSTSLGTNGVGVNVTALAHLIPRPPGEHVGERRLARAVRPHDRVHLARGHVQRHAVQDRLVGDGRVEVGDLKHSSSVDLPSHFVPTCKCHSDVGDADSTNRHLLADRRSASGRLAERHDCAN